MIFIGIFGIQDKRKIVRDYPNVVCQCGSLSRGELIEEYSYFHFFFIPLFKWNRRYFMRFRCCNRVYKVPDDYVKDLKNSNDVDTDRLEEITSYERILDVCPGCGAKLHSSFAFCPYCGARIL